MIVLDASAAVEWLERRDDSLSGQVDALLLEDGDVHVPHLWFVEIAQVLRRHVQTGELSEKRGRLALELADQLPAHRHPHEPLGPRIWALRENLSAYDAVYVALAEVLEAALVTTDASLARAPGHRAEVRLLS